MTNSSRARPPWARGYDTFPGAVDRLASRSTPAWTRTKATPGAPNVVVVLMDDLGFSDIGVYGSEIATPQIDRLAEDGYQFTNYQTPPMCAPARAALLTGVNPHRAGFSFVPHIDPGFPNSTMQLPPDTPTLAESLRERGYATFMVGKWHLTPESEINDGGDRSSWPCQRGFDRFYGFLDGMTSMMHPHRLVRDNTAVELGQYADDYYLPDVLTDEALGMLRTLRANNPEKPFLLYYAHPAVHGPLQAKPEDIEKYRGQFDAGWEHIRHERFRRQIQRGLFPPNTKCPDTNGGPETDAPSWEALSGSQKQLFARYMEVYAAMVDNADQNIGRIVSALREMGEYENTIFVFTSDNGATSEGGAEGTRSYFSQFGHGPWLPAAWERDVPRDLELVGGPQVHAHYPRGWAWASNTPFRMYKTYSHAGGVRVPMLVSWPAGLRKKQSDTGLRNQFVHAVDVAPTILDLVGPCITESTAAVRSPVDGRSFTAGLRDPALPGPRREQYTELSGRRAFIDGDWKIVTDQGHGPNWAGDAWELYDVATDPAETVDLADSYPERVASMAEKWEAAAWHNTVFPLNDDGSMFQCRPASELLLEEPVKLRRGTPVLERFRSSKLTNLRSFAVDFELNYRGGHEGVLVAHGDQGGGYVFFVEDGKLHCSYNAYGRMFRASQPLQEGARAIRANFDLVEGDLAWTITVSVDDRQPQSMGPVPQLCGMCPFTGISVGADLGGPVDWKVHERHGTYPYNGELASVRYTPGPKAPYNNQQFERAVELAFD